MIRDVGKLLLGRVPLVDARRHLARRRHRWNLVELACWDEESGGLISAAREQAREGGGGTGSLLPLIGRLGFAPSPPSSSESSARAPKAEAAALSALTALLPPPPSLIAIGIMASFSSRLSMPLDSAAGSAASFETVGVACRPVPLLLFLAVDRNCAAASSSRLSPSCQPDAH